jgi:hypothetical protein
MKMILALVATLLFSSQLLAAGRTSALDEQAPGSYRMMNWASCGLPPYPTAR